MLRKNFKKAYVSIEAVILASIIVIGGIAVLSAFLKNGQGAQAQSADMINNTIDMIGEEFDFNVSGGELPGGEETGELNEYGFYYGTYRYEGVMEPNESVPPYGYYNVTINESGSFMTKQYIEYFYGEALGIPLYDNGTKFNATWAGIGGEEVAIVTLSNPEDYMMNEYGFYYDAEYKTTLRGGEKVTYIFTEDGKMILILELTLPKEYISIVDKKVTVGGSEMGTFSEDGLSFVAKDGRTFYKQ